VARGLRHSSDRTHLRIAAHQEALADVNAKDAGLVRRGGEVTSRDQHPEFARSYIFGPDISVTGIVLNGSRVQIARRSANFIDITLSVEGSSCPYLLSWDTEIGEWIDHGKVLHKGQGKSKEYTETTKLPGLWTSFRIEEREPEIAYIDHADSS
jgi:hypothetical protein